MSDDGTAPTSATGRHPVLVAIRETGGQRRSSDRSNSAARGGRSSYPARTPAGRPSPSRPWDSSSLMAQSGMHVPGGRGHRDPDLRRRVRRHRRRAVDRDESLDVLVSPSGRSREILREADERTLVLIDEWARARTPTRARVSPSRSSKSSRSGAPRTIATTHLGAVKSHVHECEGMVNGSMAFDPDTLEPAFRFVPACPARATRSRSPSRRGFRERASSRARELRDADAARVDGLLADLVGARARSSSRRSRPRRDRAEPRGAPDEGLRGPARRR